LVVRMCIPISMELSVIVQRGFHASAWCAPLTTEGETISPSVPPPS